MYDLKSEASEILILHPGGRASEIELCRLLKPFDRTSADELLSVLQRVGLEKRTPGTRSKLSAKTPKRGSPTLTE